MAAYTVEISGLENTPQPDSVTISWEINAGWSGTLTYNKRPPMDMADTATATVTLTDEWGESITTPPLYIRDRSETESLTGQSGTYQLLDTTTVKLADATQSFDTFLDSTSTAIVAAIATRFGVSISGATEFPVWKEDVKVSDGWGPLRRIAAVNGQQLVINADGTISFVAGDYDIGASTFSPDSVTRTWKPQDRFGAILVEKNLGVGTASGQQFYDFTTPGFVPSQAMTTPLTVTGVDDVSSEGRITWVTFFNADDEQCGQYQLGGGTGISSSPNVGDYPAVKFSCLVEASTSTTNTDTRVSIVGAPPNPPPSGVDTAIAEHYGTGRGYPGSFSESLIPSKAWADDHWEAWLAEINRGTHYLDCKASHLDCSVRMLQTKTWRTFTGRIEKITWTGSPTSQSTTVHAEVP